VLYVLPSKVNDSLPASLALLKACLKEAALSVFFLYAGKSFLLTRVSSDLATGAEER